VALFLPLLSGYFYNWAFANPKAQLLYAEGKTTSILLSA